MNKAARRRRGRGRRPACRSVFPERGEAGATGPPASSARCAIDLFIEEGAYTTLAAAVTIMMVLTLLFSSVTAVWSMSRAGDVQVSADMTAMAGANVVSSYCTVATVVDACIASLGFAGLLTTGTGFVLTLIPPTTEAGIETTRVGTRILEARNKFARSASSGLKKLETALPYLVAANSLRTCAAQGSGELTYTGAAIPVPWKSGSEFSALDEEVSVDGLEDAGEGLDEATEEMRDASEETAQAKEKAWLADCGSSGRNMRERASKLSGLSAAENPDYASSVAWTPQVGIDRARAYYRWRLDNEKPKNDTTEEQANSAARTAFYRFALEQLAGASVTEVGGKAVSTVKLLPRNTEEIKKTSLYTDCMWPSSEEDGGLVLHYSSECPGATGKAGALLALSSIDIGVARECPVCKFSVGDLGKTPAASTSIDNGFEYHLRAFTKALDDYVACRNRELELEQKAKGEAEDAGEAFEDALDILSGNRPRIAPPGRYGCVALVAGSAATSPDELDTAFSDEVKLAERGAISAAVLAPDEATLENNVLASFCSTLEEHAALGGIEGILGGVMDLWGALLVGYGNLGDGLSSMLDQLISGAGAIGLGPVAQFLRDMLESAVEGLGLEPVDMRLKKPVLTDTANVLARSDIPALADAQNLLRKIPVGTTDPAELVESLTYLTVSKVTSLEITVAEIELPFGGSIPLTIRLQDVLQGVGG